MPLFLKILVSIIVVEVLGGLGAAITSDQIPGWYAGLAKPPGTPPNWLFGPVWGVLYAMMGAAFALVWHYAEPSSAKRSALWCYAVQLVLNLSWTTVFFGMHEMLMGLLILLALLVAIVATIVRFRRLRPLAGWLMAPYLVWVSYATYLNAGYWWLNR